VLGSRVALKLGAYRKTATDYILSRSPAARYTAKLQEAQKGDRPILFLVNWNGGHAKKTLYLSH